MGVPGSQAEGFTERHCISKSRDREEEENNETQTFGGQTFECMLRAFALARSGSLWLALARSRVSLSHASISRNFLAFVSCLDKCRARLLPASSKLRPSWAPRWLLLQLFSNCTLASGSGSAPHSSCLSTSARDVFVLGG